MKPGTAADANMTSGKGKTAAKRAKIRGMSPWNTAKGSEMNKAMAQRTLWTAVT